MKEFNRFCYLVNITLRISSSKLHGFRHKFFNDENLPKNVFFENVNKSPEIQDLLKKAAAEEKIKIEDLEIENFSISSKFCNKEGLTEEEQFYIANPHLVTDNIN